jgi:thiol-disulfide isomerase/thioredoxin
MFNRTNLLIVLVALFGALLGLFAGSQYRGQVAEIPLPSGVSVLRPGDMRIDLQLPDPDGRQHFLSEWKGKPLLINFWATWCGPCLEEMPLLDRIRAQTSAPGLEVVGIAIDTDDAVRAFLKNNPVGYPILIGGEKDPTQSLLFGDTRGVLPYSVLVDRDGKLLAQRAGRFSENSLKDWIKAHSTD